jgi:hypothetical protein
MIVSIHQPHFLPWMGYFNKIMHSDAFVILNTVQYRPRYYQNRAKIKRQETWQWLSVPVHANRESRIEEVTIADDNWKDYTVRTIEYTYHKTPYFKECWLPIRDAILVSETTLDGVNVNLLCVLLQILDITHVKVYRANEIPVTTTEPTGRLVELCKYLDASHYIAGRGGCNYMSVEEFNEAKIRIVYQDRDFNTITYPQLGKTFVPGLSMIDCIFNVGPVRSRELIEKAWSPVGFL